MTYYIAIDGGGTKTEGVLTDTCGRVLAHAFGTASNPNDVTLQGSVTVLTGLVDTLLDQCGLTHADLPKVSLFGGIAGGINYGPALESALRKAFPTVGALGIRSDVEILLSGELPVGDGACIICGTGSACFLRHGDGLIRIGGWGYLLDSGGSGYDIGRDALEAVLRAHDGRGAPTRLTELLTTHLSGEVYSKITEIYREGKPYIAACAPCVFEAAKTGDPVAVSILHRNARSLAEYIEAAWNHLFVRMLPETVFLPVVMGGGISRNETDFWLPLVHSQVDPAIPTMITAATAPSVFGAVVEAAKQSGRKDVDFSDLKNIFLKSYGE
ncbi:MAG: hypothetical protein IJA91_05055 [Clostridia bacterium]|nr:hypothetical protein [Clostridia bacterium]